MTDATLEDKDFMFLDKKGNKVSKDDWVTISGHPNAELNGRDYLCLRMWRLDSDKVECLKEINGVVRHVAISYTLLEKQ
jgi:hypothetical protein